MSEALAHRLRDHAYWLKNAQREITIGLCVEAADEIERLRAINEGLLGALDNRNDFIAEKGLWRELGQWLSEPRLSEEARAAIAKAKREA